MIRYSFLVPVYNVSQYINKCITSVISQEYPMDKYEIVLVDDGSTDESGKICDEFAEEYPNITVIHQMNKGLMQARKTGVINSKGEYLVFIDSDDYIDDNFLSIMDDYLAKNDVDFIMFSQYYTRNGVDQPVYLVDEKFKIYSQMQFLKLFAYTDRYNGIAGKVVKSDLLKSNIDEIYRYSVNVGEDKIQTAYLLKYISKCMIIRDCPYHYVIRNDSIIHDIKMEDIIETIWVSDFVRNIIRELLINQENGKEYKSILLKYDGNSFNNVMDTIYKFNKRKDMSVKEKKDYLVKIINNNNYFNGYNMINNNINLHNKIRGLLIYNKKVSLLLYLDIFLSYIVKR